MCHSLSLFIFISQVCARCTARDAARVHLTVSDSLFARRGKASELESAREPTHPESRVPLCDSRVSLGASVSVHRARQILYLIYHLLRWRWRRRRLRDHTAHGSRQPEIREKFGRKLIFFFVVAVPGVASARFALSSGCFACALLWLRAAGP